MTAMTRAKNEATKVSTDTDTMRKRGSPCLTLTDLPHDVLVKIGNRLSDDIGHPLITERQVAQDLASLARTSRTMRTVAADIMLQWARDTCPKGVSDKEAVGLWRLEALDEDYPSLIYANDARSTYMLTREELQPLLWYDSSSVRARDAVQAARDKWKTVAAFDRERRARDARNAKAQTIRRANRDALRLIQEKRERDIRRYVLERGYDPPLWDSDVHSYRVDPAFTLNDTWAHIQLRNYRQIGRYWRHRANVNTLRGVGMEPSVRGLPADVDLTEAITLKNFIIAAPPLPLEAVTAAGGDVNRMPPGVGPERDPRIPPEAKNIWQRVGEGLFSFKVHVEP